MIYLDVLRMLVGLTVIAMWFMRHCAMVAQLFYSKARRPIQIQDDIGAQSRGSK